MDFALCTCVVGATRERAPPARPWAMNKAGGRHDELQLIIIVVAVLNDRYADDMPW